MNSINELFISSLKKYEEQHIDIVYTPRIRIDMNLVNEPVVTYPEEIDDIKNSIPLLEFWTCIFSRSFILKNKIKFYEYKEQDVETAFRYITFSRAHKIVKNNEMKFYLQRNNLQSNTHTWNLGTLYRVKGLIYFDLFMNTSLEKMKNKEYLLEICIEQIYAYYKNSFLRGCTNKTGLDSVHNLLSQVRKEIQNVDVNVKTKIKYIIATKLDSLRKFISIKSTCKKQYKKANKYALDMNDLIIRLKKVSSKFIDIND